MDASKAVPLSVFTTEWKPSWVVEGVWQAHGLNLLYGAPRARKSTLRGYMAVCALANLPVFGTIPIGKVPERALIIGGEEWPEAEATRIRKVVAALGLPPAALDTRVLLMGPDSKVRLDDATSVKALISYCRSQSCDLVCLDPFVNFHGVPENDNSAMAQVLARLMPLCEVATVVLVHHTAKLTADNGFRSVSHQARGASAIAGFTSSNILLAKDGNSNRCVMHVEAKYAESEEPRQVEWLENGLWKESTPLARVKAALEKADGESASRIIKAAGVRKDVGLKLLKSLKPKEVVVPKSGSPIEEETGTS